MKILGIELYLDTICAWDNEPRGGWEVDVPFPKIRRYEIMEVASQRNLHGEICHQTKIKYQRMYSSKPIDVFIRRSLSEQRLQDENDTKLNKTPKLCSIISSECLN